MKRTFLIDRQNPKWGQVIQSLAGFLTAESAAHALRVVVGEPSRTLEQNAKFHAICTDVAKSGTKWAGKPRSAAAWKCLLVSGHAIATGEGADVVPGLEGEFINLRESTALMSVRRGASLIEYTQAWCAGQGVKLREPEAEDEAADLTSAITHCESTP